MAIPHRTSATAPYGRVADDGHKEQSVTETASNAPAMATGSDPLWVRITSDGTTVTARVLAQASEPTDGQWNGTSDIYSSSAFDMIGGMVGFVSRVGVASVDDLTIKSWNTGTSQFDVVEHVDTFDVDGSNRSSVDPAHDAAGNMTFDGTQKLTYDGWHRLAKVAHAYRDGSSNVQAGQANVTMSYDGRGRRVKKAVANAGQWDCTYHYYYDTDSLIETRNGSDVRVKQHVWGTRYVDELCQVKVYPASGDENPVEYWACQDSNYNVLGVVDANAVVVERYEYEPYGERTAFFSPGTNDVGCYAPTQTSRRVTLAGSGSMGICEVGHQGLVHDEEVGLVYNRARQLHPAMGRFMQRDPLGYVDGTNLVGDRQHNPNKNLDSSGLLPGPVFGGDGGLSLHPTRWDRPKTYKCTCRCVHGTTGQLLWEQTEQVERWRALDCDDHNLTCCQTACDAACGAGGGLGQPWFAGLYRACMGFMCPEPISPHDFKLNLN